MPTSFATALRALLRKSNFKSEQEARRVNDKNAKECQETDISENSRQDAKGIMAKLDKAVERCGQEFGTITRTRQESRMQ